MAPHKWQLLFAESVILLWCCTHSYTGWRLRMDLSASFLTCLYSESICSYQEKPEQFCESLTVSSWKFLLVLPSPFAIIFLSRVVSKVPRMWQKKRVALLSNLCLKGFILNVLNSVNLADSFDLVDRVHLGVWIPKQEQWEWVYISLYLFLGFFLRYLFPGMNPHESSEFSPDMFFLDLLVVPPSR